MAENTPVPLNRIERVLALWIATIGGLSILSIVAVLVAGFARLDTSSGLWPLLSVLPLIGLPLAFILVIVFMVVMVLRRRRIENGAGD